ncbi:MAG: HD domain-containing protein [Candidatus Methanomethylicia archaeon]
MLVHISSLEYLINQEDDEIRKIAFIAKKYMVNDSSGHDWHHVLRVFNLCIRIGSKLNIDLKALKIASLLHDIGLTYEIKLNVDHAVKSAQLAKEILGELGYSDIFINKVYSIILSHRYGVERSSELLEAKILQDADRLDAIGAIGIARAFAYGGARGALICNPEEEIEEYNPFKVKSTIIHFYEKLLKIRDSLNTQEAKIIAEERHKFMEEFLKRFIKEWIGEA